MMPAIGRLNRPLGVVRSTRSPIARFCSRAKLSDTITPCPRHRVHPARIFGDDRTMSSTLETSGIDHDHHDRRIADAQPKIPDSLEIFHARHPADLITKRLREPEG